MFLVHSHRSDQCCFQQAAVFRKKSYKKKQVYASCPAQDADISFKRWWRPKQSGNKREYWTKVCSMARKLMFDCFYWMCNGQQTFWPVCYWNTSWNWALVTGIKSTCVFPTVASQYVCCATSPLSNGLPACLSQHLYKVIICKCCDYSLLHNNQVMLKKTKKTSVYPFLSCFSKISTQKLKETGVPSDFFIYGTNGLQTKLTWTLSLSLRRRTILQLSCFISFFSSLTFTSRLIPLSNISNVSNWSDPSFAQVQVFKTAF